MLIKTREGGFTISVSCSVAAPKGMYRVIGIDLFERTGWLEKDCGTFEEATVLAKGKYERGNTDMHVHDETGRLVFDASDL